MKKQNKHILWAVYPEVWHGSVGFSHFVETQWAMTGWVVNYGGVDWRGEYARPLASLDEE